MQNPDFTLYGVPDSKRAYAEARVIGISPTGRVTYSVKGDFHPFHREKPTRAYRPSGGAARPFASEDRDMLKSSVIGNLGSDPELKYSANGAPFLRFNVASNGRVRDEAGNWKDETTWVRVTMFGQRAESLSQHLHKGMRVFVDGRLEARPWTGQNGQLNAGLELIATDCEFMSPRGDDAQTNAGRPQQAAGVRRDDNDNVPF